jgi:hypothetical protein
LTHESAYDTTSDIGIDSVNRILNVLDVDQVVIVGIGDDVHESEVSGDGREGEACVDDHEGEVCGDDLNDEVCGDDREGEVCGDGCEGEVCGDDREGEVCLDGHKGEVCGYSEESELCTEVQKSEVCHEETLEEQGERKLEWDSCAGKDVSDTLPVCDLAPGDNLAILADLKLVDDSSADNLMRQ